MPTDVNEFGVPISNTHSIEDFIDDQMKSTTTNLQFPEDRPKYYTTLDFSSYSFRTGGGGQLPQSIQSAIQAGQSAIQSIPGVSGANLGSTTSTPRGQITLPLPVNLDDTHVVRWDEKPIAERAFSSLLPTAAAQSALQLGLGIIGLAPNFYQTIMFDRPEYKRHELAFELAPRNYDESVMIRDIIMFINNHMAPDWQSQNVGILFVFPDIVQVTFKPNNGFTYKLKPAVVERFHINYAGGEKKAFYHDAATAVRTRGQGVGNNPPESVEIKMLLLEIEYWTAGQFTPTNT